MGGEIDDILSTDNVKDLLDKVAEDIDSIDRIIVAYTTKDDTLKWRSNCRRSEGLGMVDIVHYDLLHEED